MKAISKIGAMGVLALALAFGNAATATAAGNDAQQRLSVNQMSKPNRLLMEQTIESNGKGLLSGIMPYRMTAAAALYEHVRDLDGAEAPVMDAFMKMFEAMRAEQPSFENNSLISYGGHALLDSGTKNAALGAIAFAHAEKIADHQDPFVRRTAVYVLQGLGLHYKSLAPRAAAQLETMGAVEKDGQNRQFITDSLRQFGKEPQPQSSPAP